MPERIPASATIRVPLQAYLASDHVTPATGKTIVVTVSKNGAAYANPSAGATNATEIGSGSYYVDLSTTDTGNTVQTGDAFARIGAAGAGLTALGDTRIAHLDADVSSRSTYSGGPVASVTGNVGGIVGVTFPAAVGDATDAHVLAVKAK